MESIMQYINRHGSSITFYEDEVKTRKCGNKVMASIRVASYTKAVRHIAYSTFSVIERSRRYARVALKRELKRAMLAKDTPGFTHD